MERKEEPGTSKCMAPKCGSNNFCLGFEDDGRVYCYGTSNGCMWEKDDCSSDADCVSKYSSPSSPKYTDWDSPACPGASNWRGDACTCQPGEGKEADPPEEKKVS